MGWLGMRTALLATAATVAGLAPGAVAAGPAAPDDRTIVVRANCESKGRVVVRKVDRGDHTHVTVDGYGVPNRRWEGEYRLEVGVDDTKDVWLEFRSRNHRFHQEFDVGGHGTSGSLDLERGKPQACFAAYDEKARYTVANGTGLRTIVRHRGVEHVTIRGSLDCRIGSEWAIEVSVEFASEGTGFASSPRTCGRGWIEFGEVTDIDSASVDRPVAITLVARSSAGKVHRVAYRPR